MLSLCLLVLHLPVAAEQPFTKILVDRDGVVRVSDRELATAGRLFADGEIPRLRLTLRGKEVPVRVERLAANSSEGRFAVEFLGAFPHGKKTWEDEYTTKSAYFLSAAGPDEPPPARVEESEAPRAGGKAAVASTTTAHHEVNRRLVRFSGDAVPDESWFWEEIKATDVAPTVVPMGVDVPLSGTGLTLRVRMVGYSHMTQDPDHTVDVSWNGASIGKAVWDGETATTFAAEVEASEVKDGTNTLSLRALGEKTGGIDLVLLDWVEVTYQRRNELGAGGQALVVTSGKRSARVTDAGERELAFWSADGAHLLRVRPAAGSAVVAAPAGTWRAVRQPYPAFAVAVSHPADLKAPGRGADFVIISHERFLSAANRLAEVRRSEGLVTDVVDVTDVYDRLNDGFFDPGAIRVFLRYAWSNWSPRPRYILFVGDASWDYKNSLISDENYADWHWSSAWARSVPKIPSTHYAGEVAKNDRQFVPTRQYQSPWGHAADDNWFAVMKGDGESPDLAIGRLTVASAEEAEAVVEKILSYGRLPAGEMRSSLFITDDQEGFQRQTDHVADEATRKGYEVVKVYPKREEKDNSENSRNIICGFDEGPAFVLFIGHGGRFVWRTAPPDFAKNQDLFTLDHLDQLQDNLHLPVVVSLTCYSAPFDHPVADSIGEKMLRLPHKGAIAVVASSWRNAPPLELGRKMVELLGERDHPRIGDAFLAAKKGISDRMALSTYNLLGDPTTPYRGPETLIDSNLATAAKGAPHASPPD
jgi:hypothetical protein